MVRKISNGFTNHPTSMLNSLPTRDPDMTANFKNIGLTQFPLGSPNNTPELDISSPEFTDREAEDQYRCLLKNKLALARQFVLVEIGHNLNPNRSMSLDETAMLLAEGPIVFTLYAQECIRDLVILRSKLVDCWNAAQAEEQRIRELQQNDAGDDAATLRNTLAEVVKAQRATESRIQLVGNDHVWAWNEMGSILGYLLPVGPEEYKKCYAEWLMEQVFGVNMVEEDLDEEAEKDVEGLMTIYVPRYG